MFHLHLISDSTGETLLAAVNAARAAFKGTERETQLHQTVFVRTDRDLEKALEGARANPGPVFFTIANRDRNEKLVTGCREIGVPAIPLLDPLIEALSRHFGVEASHQPGMQHQLNRTYFARIAALDFAIAHDDGNLDSRFARADVILVGVSRTSKTPTCIYLAYRGVKAANVPLVPGREPPDALFRAMEAGTPVIGLTASPTRLAQIRAERLEALGQHPAEDYAEIDRIRREVADARLFFERHAIPMIDVTRRSIEETAAAILVELRAREDPQ